MTVDAYPYLHIRSNHITHDANDLFWWGSLLFLQVCSASSSSSRGRPSIISWSLDAPWMKNKPQMQGVHWTANPARRRAVKRLQSISVAQIALKPHSHAERSARFCAPLGSFGSCIIAVSALFAPSLEPVFMCKFIWWVCGFLLIDRVLCERCGFWRFDYTYLTRATAILTFRPQRIDWDIDS